VSYIRAKDKVLDPFFSLFKDPRPRERERERERERRLLLKVGVSKLEGSLPKGNLTSLDFSYVFYCLNLYLSMLGCLSKKNM
jgi:hypothetical protein